LGGLTGLADILVRLGFIGLLFVLEIITQGAGGIIKSAIAIKTDMGARENFVKITNNIPVRKFDMAEFVNEFELAREGFGGLVTNINDYLKFIKVVVTLALALAVMIKTSLFVFAFVMLVLFVGHKVRMKIGMGYNEAWLESISFRRISGYIQNLFFTQNIAKEIKSYNGMGEFLLNKWNKIREDIRALQHRIAKRNQTMEAFYVLFVEILKIAIIAIVIWQVYKGYTEAGSILTIWLLADTAFAQAGTLTKVFSSLFWSNARMLKAKKLMNEYLYNKKEEPYSLNLSAENAYVLKTAQFSYVEGKPALKNINLTIKQGETIAIVGENGSGKSTFITLLNGLYTDFDGEININGKPIKTQVCALRKSISSLYQDFGMYELTLRDNLIIGALHRDISDADIEEAVLRADAADILAKHGLETEIGSYSGEGFNFSGGQWQKIALARTYLNKDAKMLILDEPTAALDAKAESAVYKRFIENAGGETIILISHRLGATKFADRIIVFEKGKIVEEGTHEQLMARDGVYKTMYVSQAGMYV
jgi:ABC-type multidrug transport system fused ATPase/permease subunit